MSYFTSAYFKDPLIKNPIDDLNLPFNDYIKQCQIFIEKNRQDLKNKKDLILKANLPYELRPNNNNQKIKYGALLLHGLFDSPFIMKDIGLNLQKQGMLVRAILLPGHGTVPGSLLNVRYQDWIQATQYGIHSFHNEVDKIILVGLSTGGSLAVYHALMGAKIDAMILLSPAFAINSLIDFAANWHRVISWAWKRAAWAYIGTELDYAKYWSYPYNAAYQLYQLLGMIENLSQQTLMTCPTFMVLTAEDKVIKASTALRQFNRWPNEKNRLILYSKKPVIANDKRILIRNGSYPEMNIKSIAHAAIPVSPENSHYGMHGDYSFASHIDTKKYVYQSLDRMDELFYHYLYRFGITKLKHLKLTFNPDFDFMVSEINQFLKTLN